MKFCMFMSFRSTGLSPTVALFADFLVSITLIVATLLNAALAQTQGDPATPDGWQLDDSYRSVGVLRYASPDETLRVELSAKPATTLSAIKWLDDHAAQYVKGHEVLSLTKAARDTDIIDAAKAAYGSSGVVDAAWLKVIRQSNNNLPEHRVLAAVVRAGNPVQLTLVEIREVTPRLEEYLGHAEILAAQSALQPFDVTKALEAQSELPPRDDAQDRKALEAILGGVDLNELARQARAEVDAELAAEAKTEAAAKNTTASKAQTASPSDVNKSTTSRKGAFGTGPNAGILPEGFHNMWFIYNSRAGTKWAVMTFTDGTMTTNVSKVLSKGVASSKRDNPNRWATFTLNKRDKIIARFPNTRAPRKYFNSDPSILMSSDYKLTGCYSSQSVSSVGVTGTAGSSASISFGTFCFNRNGRFSNDRSFAIGSTGSGSTSLGTSTGGSHGTYKISGNTVVFNYANGKVLKSAFGAYRYGTDYIFAVSIGSKMFFS